MFQKTFYGYAGGSLEPAIMVLFKELRHSKVEYQQGVFFSLHY